MSDEQLVFDGFVVQDASIDIGALKGLSVAGLFGHTDIKAGDRFEVLMRVTICDKDASAGTPDKRTGDLTGRVKVEWEAKPYLDGFKVTRFLAANEANMAWGETA